MIPREEVREQLKGLHKSSDCFYGLSFGEKSDKVSLSVGNSATEFQMTIGYWRNDPAFAKGFMVATEDECEMLSGVSFETAQAAFESIKEWCEKRGLKIRPYRQPREY